MEALTFDRAIELLGITDAAGLTETELERLAKLARRRWHPDTVQHRNSPQQTARYTEMFQSIDQAVELVRRFIDGSLPAGKRRISKDDERTRREPEEIIRGEADRIRDHLRAVWPGIKAARYKYAEQVVPLSDGFRLRDLLTEDFKDDIAALSIISLYYGTFVFGIAAAIGSEISILIGLPLTLFWAAQSLACVCGLLPLSRFWLPADVQSPMIWLVNSGLRIYHWASRQVDGDKWWLQLIVQMPMLMGAVLKYVVLWPSYEIAKLVVGDKVVGVVTKTVQYYAGYADWYIEELLHKDPQSMTRDELMDLGGMYSDLGDFSPSAQAATL